MPVINRNHARIALLAAVAAIACPALLHAQTPSGDVGRALDNNLQVGSGGINSAAAQPDYRARNDAITGNVSGLGYFHGNVGYRAPGEFRGSTSDDSNFRFNAQSYSNPAASGATSSVYRSAAGTTAGDIRAAQFGQSVLIRPATTDGQGGQPTITPYGRSDYGVSAQPPGVTAQHDASMLQLQGSPLLGVRSAGNPSTALDANSAAGAARTGQVAPQPNGITLPSDPDASSDFRFNQQIDPLSRQLSRQPGLLIDSGAGDGSRMSRPTGERDYSASPRWSPSAELGSQIQSRVTNPRIDQTQTLDQRLEQIQARLYSPLGNTTVAPGQDAYLDLLTRIQDQQRRASPTPGTPGSPGNFSGSVPQPPAPATITTPAPASGTDINTSSTTPDATAATPAGPQVSTPTGGTAAQDSRLPTNILTAPTAEQLRATSEARQNQLRARGLPVQESAAAAASSSTAKPEAGKPDAAKLDAMIAALDHKLPPIATLAPKRDDALANLLKQAEEDMAAGKYFSAEQRYRSALSLNPNAPLAQVGLLHAQLGAGLTRSASLNLRQLLEEHPELIATRYDAKLLPSPQRIKAAQSEIDSLIATTARPEPAILLAYLGYQFSTPTLVQYGLNIAQTRAPADPLIPLLQRLWHSPPGNAPATNSGGAEPRK
jgi:hypothetical protein